MGRKDAQRALQEAQEAYEEARVAYGAANDRYVADPTPANRGIVTKADKRLSEAWQEREALAHGGRA